MNMLHEIGKRLKELRKNHHFSQHELAVQLGLSQGMLSSIENERSAISLTTLTRVSEIFRVSTEWLIYGANGMGKKRLEHDFIPLVDQKATAGYLRKLEEPDRLEEMGFYKIPRFTKGEFRLFEIKGDQMYPSLEENDVAICEKIADKDRIDGGTLCVLVGSDRLWVRRVYPDGENLGRYILKSDNSIYKPQSIEKKHIREAWRIKSKITSSFVEKSLLQSQRFERIEKEVEVLKQQFSQLVS